VSERPIGDYGVVGDGRTAALCSSEGSIDWLCVPRFDSEPVFGRLVGGDRAGCFSIGLDDPHETSRAYREGSAVLETRWRTRTAEIRLTEGMVLDVSSSLMPQLVLLRRLDAQGAPAIVRVRFDPRRGLSSGVAPRTDRRRNTMICSWGALTLGLRTEPELSIVPGEERVFEVKPGAPVTFLLTLADREPLILIDGATALRALEATDSWWREWSGGVNYEGPLEGPVLRSLITLRLLTYSPSGAPVAAPTTSLPESIGGSSNWDYRFSWPRDASIGLSAFLAAGKAEEAHSFMHWLLHTSRLTRPRLKVLYTLDGRSGSRERELPEVPGYRASRPVRVGNAASEQHQLDVYGWVLDAAWRLVDSGRPLHAETWRAMAGLADFVAENWRGPDAGIWETRDDPRHFVHSKVMGWVALDRARLIATSHRTRARRVHRWRVEQNAVAAEIRGKGLDRKRGSYVRSYGADQLDASLLLLPALGFDEPDSPWLEGTVAAVRQDLHAGGPLLYRCRPSEGGANEGAFLACSFWMVDALVRLGRRDEALSMFEDLCHRSNDVGLFGEEIDPLTGEQLGNFPQSLTHAALLQAALALQDGIRAGSAPSLP
jgi:GH15 family glucan-1,4-alpha-glucosidase